MNFRQEHMYLDEGFSSFPSQFCDVATLVTIHKGI
jgi:hypothetical protein